jgi:adenylate kinase
VGKGTQAEMLCETLKACQLSTGDVFRAAKAGDPATLSPAMSAALGYMKRGELVPDDTVIDMVRERINCLKCPYGFLLDGFPRTVDQAGSLDGMLTGCGLKLDAVLNFELPMDEVVTRLSGRRTCPKCKTTFHVVTKPPVKEGVCDKCGGELYLREDDRPESIRVRLQAYQDSTSPLADYYAKRGLLLNISAEGSPEKVFGHALEALKSRVG